MKADRLRTEFYFVRHAQPNYRNHDDMSRELTQKGLRDSLLVTRFLSDKNIEAVLSSPCRRAADTLGDFAAKNNLRVQLVDDFRERVVGGWIEDYNDFAAFTKKQWSDFEYKRNGGECLREAQSRNIGALSAAIKQFSGKRIAVGSHGTALSVIINYYDKSFGYEAFNRIKDLMPWIVRFVFEGENCVEIEKTDIFKLYGAVPK